MVRSPSPLTPSPWPGTAGGAYSPHWGGDVRLYVWAGIYAGATMKWGVAATDRLDSGNVWGSGAIIPNPAPPAGQLWVDVSCDVQTVETSLGGSRSDGALSRAEAATCTLKLADPNRTYDPTNPDSPFQYQGQTRLAPGTSIWVFVEYWNGTAVTQYRLFSGTVDTWDEDWQLHPDKRVATVVASDGIKDLVARDYGEQPAVGAGDTASARIDRILTYYGWTGPKNLDTSTYTLQATTLAQSAWELIGRATDDELGFTFIDPMGTLQFRNRATWTTAPVPKFTVGCAPGETTYDMMTKATGRAASLNVRNAVYASIVGGTMQVARNDPAISRYGLHSYKRTDLGLQTNGQAGDWAAFLVSLQSVPRPQMDALTLVPAFIPTVWPALLGLVLIKDRVRVLWTPPDTTTPTEVIGRVLGIQHTISRHRWETDLQLVFASIVKQVMHWGVHPNDKLTAGNLYA